MRCPRPPELGYSDRSLPFLLFSTLLSTPPPLFFFISEIHCSGVGFFEPHTFLRVVCQEMSVKVFLDVWNFLAVVWKFGLFESLAQQEENWAQHVYEYKSHLFDRDPGRRLRVWLWDDEVKKKGFCFLLLRINYTVNRVLEAGVL